MDELTQEYKAGKGNLKFLVIFSALPFVQGLNSGERMTVKPRANDLQDCQGEMRTAVQSHDTGHGFYGSLDNFK